MLIQSLADMAMPRTCIVCGDILNLHERHLCLRCLSDFPYTRFETINHNPMSDKLNALIAADIDKDDRNYEPYSYACALFYYSSESGHKAITQALKYHRNFSAGHFFSEMLGQRMSGTSVFKDIDVIAPVPLHWTRKLRRGYNQAEIIAKGIAAHFPAATLAPALLRRKRRTKSQTRLNVAEKALNVKDSFVLGKDNSSLQPRHILLVDDVFTTGSTLAACHKALRKRYGADVRISIATLAFVQD